MMIADADETTALWTIALLPSFRRHKRKKNRTQAEVWARDSGESVDYLQVVRDTQDRLSVIKVKVSEYVFSSLSDSRHKDFNRVLARQPRTSIDINTFEASSTHNQPPPIDTLSVRRH